MTVDQLLATPPAKWTEPFGARYDWDGYRLYLVDDRRRTWAEHCVHDQPHARWNPEYAATADSRLAALRGPRIQPGERSRRALALCRYLEQMR